MTLVLSNVDVVYAGVIHVLRSANLSVPDGQMVVLLGSNATTWTQTETALQASEAMRTDLGIKRVLTGYGLTETCGTVTMSNNSQNYILGGGTFTNKETIQGSGTIGNGNLTLVNNGTIAAGVSNGGINATANREAVNSQLD